MISFVIPCYNVDELLYSTVQSIINQNLELFEIIIVNDGSLANSDIIFDQLPILFPGFINIVYQDNSGVTEARKKGVKIAKGDYIMFLDSDDELLPNVLLDFYKFTVKNNFDICFGGVVKTIDDSEIYNQTPSEFGFISRIDYQKRLLTRRIQPGPYAKFFKREILLNPVWSVSPEIKVHEDFLMNLQLSLLSSKIGSYSKTIYNYKVRKYSVLVEYENSDHWLENEKVFKVLNILLKTMPNLELYALCFKLKLFHKYLLSRRTYESINFKSRYLFKELFYNFTKIPFLSFKRKTYIVLSSIPLFFWVVNRVGKKKLL